MPNDNAASAVVTKPQDRQQLPMIQDSGEFSMLLDSAKFHQLQRIGHMYATSKMVPQHFQGDEASCMVAVQMAMRLQVDPFMFLQKTYVVGGKPGMEAQMAIALVNTRGPFEGPIDWNFKHDDNNRVIEATAFATHRKTGRVCSSTLTWETVVAEGWDKNKKWTSLREQMFAYRSAVFLARRYCPEVLMGMAMAEELEEIDITPAATRTVEPANPAPGLKEKLGIPRGAVIDAEPSKAAAKPGPDATTEQLVESGHIVIHEEAVQAASGGAQATLAGVAEVKPANEAQKPANAAGALPFDNALGHAKRAKTQGQVDLVRDAMRDAGYSEAQKAEIEVILKSKSFSE